MVNKGNWSSGWDICVDADNDNACTGANDTQLRTVDPIPAGYSISTNRDDYSTFMPDGLLQGRRAATLTISDNSGSSTSRIVTINVLGRANLQ
jgi:Tfp pilus assembly protein FimT